MAQKNVNEATLDVVSESITNPAPDSFDLDLVTQMVTTSKYHPDLEAFEGSLYLEGSDVPFVSFTTPAIKAENGAEGHVQQRVQIQNMTEFTHYTMVALGSKTYTVYLRGNGGLRLGSLPKTTVDYNQKIEIAGELTGAS